MRRHQPITKNKIRGLAAAAGFLLLSLVSFGQRNKPYREDLSGLRPNIGQPLSYAVEKDSVIKKDSYGIPTKTVNAKVDAVLDSIDVFNLTRKFIDGYTIQVYSGQKREDAMNTKKKIQDELPDLISNLQYLQPKFRVTVGKYFSKLEAQKDLLALKGKFATAILVPEKIMIR